MKKLLSILLISFYLTNTSHANDIKDFQIEGMSIGDSLLDYMSEEEILNNKRNYFKGKRKYYVVGIYNNLEVYQVVDVYLKTKDKKYIIKTIGGMKDSGNLRECLNQKEAIKKEFDEIFSNLETAEHIKSHEFDKSGDSKQYQSVYYFGNGSHRDNHIRIECDNWSKKIKKENKFNDGLNIVAMTTEILDWVYSDYK